MTKGTRILEDVDAAIGHVFVTARRFAGICNADRCDRRFVAAITILSAMRLNSRRCRVWASCRTTSAARWPESSLAGAATERSERALTEHGDREYPRTDHLRDVQNRHGFRDAR